MKGLESRGINQEGKPKRERFANRIPCSIAFFWHFRAQGTPDCEITFSVTYRLTLRPQPSADRSGQPVYFLYFGSVHGGYRSGRGGTDCRAFRDERLQKELRSRILGVTSHIEVVGMDGALQNWQQVAAQALTVPRVLAAAPYVQGQVMLNGRNQEAGDGPVFPGSGVRGAVIRGIDPQQETPLLTSTLI